MTEVVLFLHLIGALAFVAGVVLAGVAFESARRRQTPREVALLLGLARTAVPLVLGGAVLVLGCGLWLTGLEREIGYGTAWVDAAIALFAIALLLGGLGGQKPKQARLLATRLAEQGEETSAELRALLDDPLARWLNYASAILILAILALMVFKP